jgi:hypothetical protein
VQYEEKSGKDFDDSDDDEDGDSKPKAFRFNEYEVRDAFLEFMQSLMFGYTKCLVSFQRLIFLL